MRGKIFVGAAATLAALFLGAAPAGANSSPPPFQCNKTLNGGTINNNVAVGKNAVCILNNVTVSGSVSVANKGYLEANGSKITGNVIGNYALTLYIWNHSTVSGNVVGLYTPQVFVYDSTVGKNVAAYGSVAPGYGHFQVCGSTVSREIGVAAMGPDVLVGDPAAGCGANTIAYGDIIVANNRTDTEVYVIGNNVQNGDIGVWSNHGAGPGQVSGNNAPHGDLFCSNNSAPFSGSGNGSVGDVSGPQCSATTITGDDNDDD